MLLTFNGKKITFLGVSSGICAPTAKGQIGAELAFDAIRAHALTAKGPEKEGDFDPRRIFIDNETESVVTVKDLYDYIDEMDNSDIFFQDLKKQPDDPKKNDRFARHIGYLNDIFKRIRAKVYETLKYTEFPFMIAGDHSTAAATIGGIKRYLEKYEPEKKLGVIWIDAHVDAHCPHSTPSGNMHGMPVGIVCGIESNLDPLKDLDHESIRREIIKEEDILDKWRKLYVDPKDVNNLNNYDFVFIGIRHYEPHEYKFLLGRDIESKPHTKPEAKQPTKHYKYSDGFDSSGKVKEFFPKIRNENNEEKTMQEVCEETIKYFKANKYDYLYISFDIDSITGIDLKKMQSRDEALNALSSKINKEPIFGTGTPVSNGLSLSEVKYILNYFMHVQKEIPIIAFEIVEVSPLLDIQNKTAEIAFDIVKSLINPEAIKNK
jgi:arginase